jgi:hypothetical protein
MPRVWWARMLRIVIPVRRASSPIVILPAGALRPLRLAITAS